MVDVPPLDVRGQGWGLGLADPTDRGMNRELCELFASVRLESALSLTQERDPDFFVLPSLHQGAFATAVAVDDHGHAVGCGTLCVRDGWLFGELIKTGYLCDLRVAPGFRGGKHLARAYKNFMDHMEARFGAELFTTVIFDSNKAAIAALTHRSHKRLDQPIYRPMTPFEMVSVQFTRKKSAASSKVREARPEDFDALCEYLAARAKTRLLGEALTPERFRARLALWPGFSWSDFLIARDDRDRIVGCLAPWDTSSFKRTRVLGYRGGMLWQKRAFDVAASLMGFPKLPPPGDCFRFVFLTHLEIDDENPDVFRDLLHAAYARLRGRGLHFMSAFIPRGSPLSHGLKGFMTTKTAMTLNAVHRPDSRFADVDLATRRPGFEMALS